MVAGLLVTFCNLYDVLQPQTKMNTDFRSAPYGRTDSYTRFGGNSMTDQHEQLRARLARLRREGGDVSTREIARRSHGAVSHTTVHQVLRGKSVPSWRSLAAIVAVLGGDE